MNLGIHKVERIEVETSVYTGDIKFNCLKMSITDRSGNDYEINLFSDDLESLNLISKGVSYRD